MSVDPPRGQTNLAPTLDRIGSQWTNWLFASQSGTQGLRVGTRWTEPWMDRTNEATNELLVRLTGGAFYFVPLENNNTSQYGIILIIRSGDGE